MADVEVPEHVRKAFGDDAVRCEPCGGWHHRNYHQVRCWEVPDWDDAHQTCMLLDGHDGPHEFTPDSDITVRFK